MKKEKIKIKEVLSVLIALVCLIVLACESDSIGALIISKGLALVVFIIILKINKKI